MQTRSKAGFKKLFDKHCVHKQRFDLYEIDFYTSICNK